MTPGSQNSSDMSPESIPTVAPRRSFALWPALSLAFYLLWTYSELALTELPEHYAHIPWVCTSALLGLGIRLLLDMRHSPLETSRVTAPVCAAACITSTLALLAPGEQPHLISISLSCVFCGFVCMSWAKHFATIPKEHIIPTVALAGLVGNLLLMLQAAGLQVCTALLIIAPLGCAVFAQLAAFSSPVAEQTPLHDKLHTSWPLPCATLICTLLASSFASFLEDPVTASSSNGQTVLAVVGAGFCLALLGWSLLAQRRNLNGFLVAAVSVLEIALLAYASGVSARAYIPVIAISSMAHVLSILLWILAASLARSPRTHVTYTVVFGAFMLLGSGFLGRLVGFTCYFFSDLPYTALQQAALVLLVVIAALFLLFFCIEVLVMRRDLETQAAEQVAAVRDEAAQLVGQAEREAQAIRNVAEQRIKLAEAEAALKVLQAEKELEATRSEAAEQIEEARLEVESVRSLASRKLKQAEYLVADMQARDAKRTQISIREACDMLAKQHNLTTREHDAFFLICDGMNRSEIAKRWTVSENTVKYHLRNLYKKVGVHNSRDLIAYADQFRMDFDTSKLPD